MDPPTPITARRGLPAAPPEPDLEPPTMSADEPIPPDDEPGDMITKPQSVKLHALLNEQGMGERDAGLACLSDILDRPVETSKTLTRADASKVIEALTFVSEDPFPPEPPVEGS